MGDIEKIPAGAAKVSFGKTAPALFDLTKGITFNFSQSTQPITVDQYGDMPVKEIVSGQVTSVEVGIAEADFAKLTKVIPGSTYDSVTKTLTVSNAVGMDLRKIADELKIMPNVEGAFDTMIFPKAAPRPNIQRSFTANGEHVFNVTFTIYPDDDGKIVDFVEPTEPEE